MPGALGARHPSPAPPVRAAPSRRCSRGSSDSWFPGPAIIRPTGPASTVTPGRSLWSRAASVTSQRANAPELQVNSDDSDFGSESLAAAGATAEQALRIAKYEPPPPPGWPGRPVLGP
jgi:hypothetical protein